MQKRLHGAFAGHFCIAAKKHTASKGQRNTRKAALINVTQVTNFVRALTLKILVLMF